MFYFQVTYKKLNKNKEEMIYIGCAHPFITKELLQHQTNAYEIKTCKAKTLTEILNKTGFSTNIDLEKSNKFFLYNSKPKEDLKI